MKLERKLQSTIKEPALARWHKQRGASLLEAIAYLGIAAIVVIGAVALLSGAFSSANTNQLNEQVNSIQTGVKKLYMGQSGGYTGLTNSVLATAGVLPTTLQPAATGSTITDEWAGDVTITGGGNTFTIEFTNVPQSVCVNTVTAGGNWTGILINTVDETTLPITPAKASTDCSTSTNTITWTST